MSSDLHPWVRCLTRSDGLQLIRYHIAASHSQLHSGEACPASTDLVAVLTACPWHTQPLLRNQPDDIIQCLARRLSQGGVTLELLLELQTGQFDLLLHNAMLGAHAAVRKAFIAALSGAVSALPTAFFSLQTPVDFRIALCRHFMSIQRPVTELRPVIDSILKSSISCQAFVLDLFSHFGDDADLLYSFISHDSSCFSNHILEPMVESTRFVSIRLFELILFDDDLHLILLNPDAISKYKITSSFVSNLSLALKNIWGSPLFSLTNESCRLLLGLGQKLLIEDDVLTAIIQNHNLPTPARADYIRFCILSRLSKHKQMFSSILKISTSEDLAVVSLTLANLITYQKIFGADILEDALSSLREFITHTGLIENLLGSAQFVNSCIRNLEALQFVRSIAEEHRLSINAELAFSAVTNSLRQISAGCPHAPYLHDFVAFICDKFSPNHNTMHDLVQVVLDLDPINSKACDMLVSSISPLISHSSHIAIVYEAISRYFSRKRPVVLRLILKILNIRHLPPPNIDLIRMWLADPHTKGDELIILKILSESLYAHNQIIDLIPDVIMRFLTFQDESVRIHCVQLIEGYKPGPQYSSILSLIRWRIQELERSKRIGCCKPSDTRALVILKCTMSRLTMS